MKTVLIYVFDNKVLKLFFYNQLTVITEEKTSYMNRSIKKNIFDQQFSTNILSTYLKTN